MSKLSVAEIQAIYAESGKQISYNAARSTAFCANMTYGTKEMRADLVRQWIKNEDQVVFEDGDDA